MPERLERVPCDSSRLGLGDNLCVGTESDPLRVSCRLRDVVGDPVAGGYQLSVADRLVGVRVRDGWYFVKCLVLVSVSDRLLDDDRLGVGVSDLEGDDWRDQVGADRVDADGVWLLVS